MKIAERKQEAEEWVSGLRGVDLSEKRAEAEQWARVLALVEAAKYLKSVRGSPLEKAGVASVLADLEALEKHGDI